MSDCVRAGEGLSSAREATTPRPSSRGLRLFPIRSRIICGMGGALRRSRTILGSLQCPGTILGSRVSVESRRWESRAPSTWYKRLRYSGAESWSPSCTGSRTSDPRVHSRSGQWNLRGQKKKMDAGATGTQVAGEQTTRTSDPAVHPEVRPLLVLPLHVGVLQCLLSTKPLVRSKCQESLEEVQGFWGGVWRQEGVQRLPWPAGSRLSSPL